MMPTKFWKAWIEIDPELKHGGIPDELAPYYVGPDIGDNPSTQNPDQLAIFLTVQSAGRSISMAPEAMKEGSPRRRIVEEALTAANDILERIVDQTTSNSSRTFEWCHAIPPMLKFGLAPIRYPLRQPFANEFVHYMIGTLVEIAELNVNANHKGLDINAGAKAVAPIYAWKAGIIKYYFDHEVAGEISSAELDTLFGGRFRPGPTVSVPDESAERPDMEAVSEALSGIDVLQWFPTEADWAVFGKLDRDRYVPERIYQPEGSVQTTEDVAFEHPVDDTGASMIGQNAQP